jgi:hypothetical protein
MYLGGFVRLLNTKKPQPPSDTPDADARKRPQP